MDRDSALDVPFQRLRSNLSAINHARFVDADSLGGARVRCHLDRIGDEKFHRSITRAADANAALPRALATVAHRPRLRVGDVDVVLRVDVDAARTAELIPGVEELAILVEDLDAIVAAVADEEATAG